MFEVPRGDTRKSWTVPFAMVSESLVIGALMLMPAKHALIRPLLVSEVVFLAPAPPPPPPPPAGIRRPTPTTVIRKFDPTRITAPVRIPTISNVETMALPDAPDIADGVPGGVPGGVVGGVPGGVLGGVLGGFAAVLPPPPPPVAVVPTSTPKPPARLFVGGDVQAALLVHEVAPKYPRLASVGHITGTVRLKAIIGCDGRVKDLSLISGPPLLAQAAEEAVSQWVYKPTLLNGVPYEVATDIAVTFSQLVR